jgi:hypothetical protein
VNKELYYQTIEDAGLKRGFVDKQMGITAQGRILKIQKDNFKSGEMVAYQRATRCSDGTLKAIFLT